MSADAKAWTDENGAWHVLHDGPCVPASPHGGTFHDNATPHGLAGNLNGVETCMGGPLRWEFRTYPDGTVGLVGWTT